jgi:glutamine amidotransferase
MIAIIDYGVGNLHSVQKAIEYVGGNAVVADDAQKILSADKVILPGVGAFKDGMDGLKERDLISVINRFVASGKPFLGICLGMQLLFEYSEEMGLHQGLGLLPGNVFSFRGERLKVPQIGWNQLDVVGEPTLLADIPNGAYAYFNHSLYALPQRQEHILAKTTYEIDFASVVGSDNIYGVQFHPEKSQKVGLQILKNFVEKIS